VAYNMRAFYTDTTEERAAVSALLGDADLSGRVTAGGVAAPVVENKLEPAHHARLCQERPERVCKECPVDEDDRLASTGDLILKRYPVNDGAVHRSLPSHLAGYHHQIELRITLAH
jgi:hypothetical protein